MTMTQHEFPLVSIIMPAYNAGLFIKESIESVIAQTYPYWELIIIDDGSIDETIQQAQILDDSRIRLIAHEHTGINSAVRNVGLSYAQGDYIAFLDSDDLYLTDALECRVEYLKSHPTCTAVYGFSTTIDENGRASSIQKFTMLEQMKKLRQLSTLSNPLSWDDLLINGFVPFLQALMLRRETLLRVGSFNEQVFNGSDFLYYIKLFIDDFQGVHPLERNIFLYRVYGTSVSTDAKRFERVLSSIPIICNEIFSNSKLPIEVKARESEFCARIFGGCYARLRLENGQKQHARQIVVTALKQTSILPLDWLRFCVPFWVRSFLPNMFERRMRQLWLEAIKPQLHKMFSFSPTKSNVR